MRIKKNDIVKILSGKDRGKTGKVFRVDVEHGKILVEGMNLKKKHVRSKRQDKKGEIVVMPKPFDASNALPVCGSCKKPNRPKFIMQEKKKIRICRKCGNGF